MFSDTHRLFNLAVPKAGSIALREAMLAADPGCGNVDGFQRHPELGLFDHGHVTLRRMRDHFPELWEKARAYFSFTALREPAARFRSAMDEWLRATEKTGLHRLDDRGARRRLHHVVDRLGDGAAEQGEPLFTWFQRQADFVTLDGERVADAARLVEDMDLLLADIEAAGGLSLPRPERRNATAAIYSHHRPSFPAVRAVARRLLPRDLRARLMPAALRPADPAKLLADPGIRSFLETRYAADFELTAQAAAQAAKDREAAA